jgi:FkbM family methyltransferase
MSTLTTFSYSGITYQFEYDANDRSEAWCVDEIVHRDEYVLSSFKNINAGHIVDIGANCGVATIILAKQNPNSTIYSFEPDRKLFAILTRNVQLNELNNVKLFNKAVSKPGQASLTLMLHPLYSGGNTTYSDPVTFKQYWNNTDVEYYTVDCISLDAIISDNNIDTIELLKIDSEGSEYDILQHCEALKEGKIRNMVGEFHDLSYNVVNTTANELLTYCKPLISGIFKVSVLQVS